MTESHKKKLIEVALPLEAINRESAREKSIRHGHPSTLHLWWARRPLAACRAVLFASLVDDPSSNLDQFPTEEDQERERQRLFRIIEELVKWENTTNETVLNAAREEILKSTGGNAPPVLDPFCGGGSIPLEAQRLGLEAHASDLNPVAVLITKALIEIPPRFADRPPVNPESRRGLTNSQVWKGAAGLAADVRYYGKWMRDEAERRFGHLYPKVKLPKELGGKEATVIAWLWARTVKCPNPACGATIPMMRSFWLSKRSGAEAWLEAVADRKAKRVRFMVHSGRPPAGKLSQVDRGTKTGRGANFSCPMCNTATPREYVRDEANARGLGAQLTALVLEGERRRCYVSASQTSAIVGERPRNIDVLKQPLADDARAITVKLYGYKTFDQLFGDRQLTALLAFSDIIAEARDLVINHSNGDEQYADAVATYLAFALDKGTNYWSTLCGWHYSAEKMMSTLGRQALPMIWDYAEANPFSSSSGNWMSGVDQAAKAIETLPTQRTAGRVHQLDAAQALPSASAPMVSTDPPYFDNVPYSDVSDYFYVWLKRALNRAYPELFSTLLTPKKEEIVAFSYRFEGDQKLADRHFEERLGQAFRLLREKANPKYPTTIYYAFKQQEEGDGELAGISTGWEKMLEGLSVEFQVTGTWPMRTEQSGGLRLVGRNSLASSIVLVCRPRAQDAALATRREFIAALARELPHALKQLQHGNIAPVDLAQAAIGPGMAVFSRYSKVIESDGSPMRVRTALQLINQALDEVLAEQESEYDADTRWALAWFEQFGVNEGAYGTAETLSKAKNTSVNGMVEAEVVASRGGKVRLLRRDELPDDWDPAADSRLTVWELTQHLIRALEKEGEPGAAALLKKIGALGEVARDLAYRLYTTSERKGWAQEALAYNSLVVAWPAIARLASSPGARESGKLPGMEER